MERLTLRTTPEEGGLRADVWLAARVEALSRSSAARLLEDGRVTRNGKPLAKRDRLTPGETVEVLLPDPTPAEVGPEDIPLDVVYEDEEVKDYPFGCNFSRHATIEPLLKVFEATGTIETSIHGRKIWIRKRK